MSFIISLTKVKVTYPSVIFLQYYDLKGNMLSISQSISSKIYNDHSAAIWVQEPSPYAYK